MDALALLCNLHADGAQTLRELRDQNCHTLEDLCAWEPQELAGILGTDERKTAERFIEQACGLELRLTGRPLQPSAKAKESSATAEEQQREAPAPDEIAPRPPVSPIVELEHSEPSVAVPRPAPEASSANGREAPYVRTDPMVNVVLSTWQKLDTDRPGDLVRPSAAGSSDEVPTAAPVAEPERPSLHPLVEAQLDGLDARTCERFAAVGLGSLEGLVQADALALAQCSGLAFTRVRRLQFSARRLLEGSAN